MGFIARFFALVLFLSIAELYLLVELSARTSVLLTFALCAFTGIVGGAMVRAQGLKTLAEIQRLLGMGKMPGEQIVSGLILLSIGIMLLTPGFITDSVAFAMLIPPLRRKTARLLTGYFKGRVTTVQFGMGSTMGQGPGGPRPSGPSPGPAAGDAGFGTRRRNEDVVIEVDAEE